jgi:hypothetical protein
MLPENLPIEYMLAIASVSGVVIWETLIKVTELLSDFYYKHRSIHVDLN